MKKKTVAIIAPTGMLGSMVYRELKKYYHLVLIYRDKEKLDLLQKEYGNVTQHRTIRYNLSDLISDFNRLSELTEHIGPVDRIINCAGITKPESMKNPQNTYHINGIVPHMLSSVYREKLIHITTDCVYDGITGAPYDETSELSPPDLYGMSKAAGEPSVHSLVLRTSIIGPEIAGKYLLIEWLKKQEGTTVNGFSDHLWNGVTTHAFAHICRKLIDNPDDYPHSGLFHVFSTDVTKYDMLVALVKKYALNITVQKTDSGTSIDRRLSTIHSLNKKLSIPPFEAMIKNLP